MPADPDRIAIAQARLAELGVTLADLQRAQRPPMPTVAEYLPQVIAAAGPGTRRTYAAYWQRMATAWAARPLDTITASDVEALQRQVAATARSRRNNRNGRHAGELAIAAARAIYVRAIADGRLAAPGSRAGRRRRVWTGHPRPSRPPWPIPPLLRHFTDLDLGRHRRSLRPVLQRRPECSPIAHSGLRSAGG